ncbi:MAG: sigma-70 family RNA polymerase sigma factor [Myxococcales bacterium]|nr:sigma-70 family RNA polymerase sigma factor [Myxococcales bacterium]
MHPEPSDAELVRRWRSGDRAAARAFIERYHDAVMRFFFNKTSEANQEDLIQQTFLAFIHGLPHLDDASKARSYLFGAAYRLLCRHYEVQRIARERADVEPAPPKSLTSPSRELIRREELRLLLRALRRLPIEYQAALELHYWEQMTTSEIGDALDLPSGTVKSRLRRGRELLSEAMASISSSPELLRSTLDNLDRWARSVRGGSSAA